MGKKVKIPINSLDENMDRDKKLKDTLNAEAIIIDLAFNEETNSLEFDINAEEGEFGPTDPYKTIVENGEDFNSDYDEANKAALDQYSDNPNNIIDEYGMHIDSGKIVEVSPEDEELAKTPEDERDDLDEEGYPKNDAVKDNGDNMK